MEGIKKIVVIGGAASGAAFASRIRRMNDKVQIVVIEKTKTPSFASCGMPYVLGGKIDSMNKLNVAPLGLLKGGLKFDLRLETELVKILNKDKKVVVRDIKNNKEYEETYDKLVLALGSHTWKPPVPGINGKNIFTLQNINDLEEIYNATKDAKDVMVLGGGLIGIECAENLKKIGKGVTIVEIMSHVIPALDDDMALPLHRVLVKNGVKLHLNSQITKFEYDETGKQVKCYMKKKIGEDKFEESIIEVSYVIVGTGARPNSSFMKEAGLELNRRGGVVVDEHLLTSDKDVYALGDLIETVDTLSGNKTYVPLANAASVQGRTAANHLLGKKPNVYKGSIGTGIFEVFGLMIGLIGNNEGRLKYFKTPYRKLYHMTSHIPNYMPQGEGVEKFNVSIKVLFNDDGKILGSQVVGKKGVDVVANTISLALYAKLSVYDLQQVELPYCPVTGNSRSPLSMIGKLATGILEGTHDPVFIDEVIEKKIQVIDIRPPPMYKNGHIPGAINIPFGKLRMKMKEGTIKKDTEYAISCMIGKKGYWASRVLKQNGYTVRFISGGYLSYKRHFGKI